MADDRSKEDVLAGVLRISVGGVEKLVPTLKLRGSRDWQALVADKLAAIKPALAADPTADTIAGVTRLAMGSIVELILEYDKTSALGGREWLEDNADPAQLYAAVRQMGQVAFPFVDDLVTLVAAFPTLFVTTRQDGPSDGMSSTNGRSPSGASSPTTSKSASTLTS